MKKSIFVLFLFSVLVLAGCAQISFSDSNTLEKSTDLYTNFVIPEDPFRSTCGGAIQCNCGDTVIEDAVLDHNLNCPGYSWGLLIGEDNITLDCNNHIIRGSDTLDTYGIYVNIKSYNTIKNCIVQDWLHGILIREGASFNNITNNNFMGNTGQGIFAAYDSSNNLISNNNINGNGNGLILYSNSNDNIVKENNIYNNTQYGINLLQDSRNNILFNNTLSENDVNPTAENAYEDASSVNNYWNTTYDGNNWDDFESNPGYPINYEIPGPGDGIDWRPNLLQPDMDNDGIPDEEDNCVATFNPPQTDLDEDGVGDWCDNCILHENPDQEDLNGDWIGDACEGCKYNWNEICLSGSILN